MLRHCLPRTMFDTALRSGLLRSSRSIDASPLTLLITQLECWRRSLPYIAVRDATTHVKRLFCPYWVHDAITTLARMIPALLVDADLQVLMRAAVAEPMEQERTLGYEILPNPARAEWNAALAKAQGRRVRSGRAAEAIWSASGATAGWASHMPGMLGMWLGKKPS